MQTLRTPDARFVDLAEFPYAPQYCEVSDDDGGGLRLAAEHPERFRCIVVANTGPPTGDVQMPDIWWRFREAIQAQPAPDDPATPANRSAWARLCASPTPMLVAFSDGDPITGAMAPIFQREMRGAQGTDHPQIRGAGHFLQEDAGEELAGRIAAFLAR